MSDQPISNDIVARLTGRSGPMEDPDLCADALGEIERVRQRVAELEVMHERQRQNLRYFLAARTAEPPAAVNVAPIASITVKDGDPVGTCIYAPGLPDGEHELFPVPLNPAGEMKPLMQSEPPAERPSNLRLSDERIAKLIELCSGANPGSMWSDAVLGLMELSNRRAAGKLVASAPPKATHREALLIIRDRTRSDPADFKTAFGDLREIYNLCNMALLETDDTFARPAETKESLPSDRLPDATPAHTCGDGIVRIGTREGCSVCHAVAKPAHMCLCGSAHAAHVVCPVHPTAHEKQADIVAVDHEGNAVHALPVETKVPRSFDSHHPVGPNGECPICGSVPCKPGCIDGSEIL